MRRSWNPLACGGTALPANVLLSGKLLALWLMVHRGPTWSARIHLPFVPVFDRLGPVEPFLLDAVTAAFLLFTVTLLVNRIPRTSCVALGTIVLLTIAMNRTAYANNLTFAGSFLLLLGLQDGRPAEGDDGSAQGDGLRWLLRAQLVLVYLGAGVNKLLDADWRSGVYFEFWTHRILEHELYVEMAAALPPLLLSKAMCWFVIGTELALAIGFALPRLYRWVIAAGVFFHVGMLVFTGGQISWLFLYVMCASYAAVAPWPRTPLEVRYRGRAGRWLQRVAGAVDVEGLYRWHTGPTAASVGEAEAGIVARESDPTRGGASDAAPRPERAGTRPPRPEIRSWSGPWAVLVVLLTNPVVYAHLALLLLWRPLPGFVSQVLYLVKG